MGVGEEVAVGLGVEAEANTRVGEEEGTGLGVEVEADTTEGLREEVGKELVVEEEAGREEGDGSDVLRWPGSSARQQQLSSRPALSRTSSSGSLVSTSNSCMLDFIGWLGSRNRRRPALLLPVVPAAEVSTAASLARSQLRQAQRVS